MLGDIKHSAEAYVSLSISQGNNPEVDLENYQNYIDDVVSQWGDSINMDAVERNWKEAIQRSKK